MSRNVEESQENGLSTKVMSQHVTRIILALFMVFAGVAHLSFSRESFAAQVPVWLPLDTDFVVVASGIVEIALGMGLLMLPRYRWFLGITLAVFFVLVFPGNINQYVEGINAFGLDTDEKRLIRLFFQPLLVLAALWAAGGLRRPQRKVHP